MVSQVVYINLSSGKSGARRSFQVTSSVSPSFVKRVEGRHFQTSQSHVSDRIVLSSITYLFVERSVEDIFRRVV